jgi:hypothetical protein
MLLPRHLHFKEPLASEPRASSAWVMPLLPALPALAIALLWWPSLSASFQFDDWNAVVNDPRLRSLAHWWQSMPGIRPLLKLTYTLNFAVGAEPAGFRVVNILIHASSATLVCWLLRDRGLRAGLSTADATRAALLAALIFALHPVQTEAVTYISGRSTSLSACLCLLSLFCWVRSEQSAAWLAACCICFAAAVASKETALVLPFALLLFSADQPPRSTLKRLAPLLMLALVALLFALSLPKYRYLLAVSLDTRSVGDNLLTQSHALLYLAGQLVRITNGNADPQLAVITDVSALSAVLCLAWLAVLAVALLKIRKAPVGAFATLWFLLWLAPTNSVLPRLDVANDRQLYLALVGPAWWLAVRVSVLHRARSATGNVAAAALLVLLAYATFQRNRIYDTEVSFWQDTVARNPSNARAANNLGMAYALDCRLDAAMLEFERSATLNPEDYHARVNAILLRQGMLPGAEPRRCADNGLH